MIFSSVSSGERGSEPDVRVLLEGLMSSRDAVECVRRGSRVLESSVSLYSYEVVVDMIE